MIVGVGGQGTLLASKLLGRILLENGYDVKVSEVHGMSQRGGSVVTYVRYGEKVYSPIIDKGEADFVLSFELLEAARWAEYLKKGGVLLTNTQKVNPMPVITGAAEYPKALEEKLTALPIRLDAMDALGLARSRRARPRQSISCCWADSAGISTLRTNSGRTRLRRAFPRNSSNSTKRPSRSARRRKA